MRQVHCSVAAMRAKSGAGTAGALREVQHGFILHALCALRDAGAAGAAADRRLMQRLMPHPQRALVWENARGLQMHYAVRLTCALMITFESAHVLL